MVAGCGALEPTPASEPATATLIAPTATDTPPPPTATSPPTTPSATLSSPLSGRDGGRFAVASTRDGTLDIYVMDVAAALRSEGAGSGNVTRLTNDPEHDSGPIWSPDGTHIAFMSERSANHDLYVMDVGHALRSQGSGGSNPVRLTTDPADDHGATWSPAGAQLAFTSNRSGNLAIYVMDVEAALRGAGAGESNVIRLTDNPADDANAAWSPEGARIAFVSDRGGDLNVYVMDIDGS